MPMARLRRMAKTKLMKQPMTPRQLFQSMSCRTSCLPKHRSKARVPVSRVTNPSRVSMLTVYFENCTTFNEK